MENWIEEKMRKAASVSHWNELREEVKSKLHTEKGPDLAMKAISELDQSGLIVKVLGKDAR